MIKIIQGIEGDDIPYHLSLLGVDIHTIDPDIYFFPLNDHYNTHGPDWLTETEKIAQEYPRVVFYDLVNTSDYEHRQFCRYVSEFDHVNRTYLTVNQSPDLRIPGVRIIPWDFMWNRIKAYYTESVPANLCLHHYAGPDAYQLPGLVPVPKTKKFMSLTGREYGFRIHLYNWIKQYDGFVSNRTRGQYLENHEVVGAFSPVPNRFYQESCLSIYVESNCYESDLIHITEKTYEPLLKGHFILPFSNPGTVNRLEKLGFQFPNCIDYSYDLIENPDARFRQLKREFLRLLDLDLYQLHSDHVSMFEYNQNCVHTIPYDSRILRIFDV